MGRFLLLLFVSLFSSLFVFLGECFVDLFFVLFLRVRACNAISLGYYIVHLPRNKITKINRYINTHSTSLRFICTVSDLSTLGWRGRVDTSIVSDFCLIYAPLAGGFESR